MCRPVVLLLLLLVAGCINPTGRYTEIYGNVTPSRYVIVVPQARERLAAIDRFIEFKSAQGFEVHALSFDLSDDPAERFASVRDGLAGMRSEDGSPSYLLILADAHELPMGPWPVEGLDDRVESEVPLLLGSPIELGQTIMDEEWEDVFTGPPAWIAGRIPYADPQLISLILDETCRVQESAEARGLDALLGGERFFIASDSGRILSKARDELRARGWRAELWSQDAPRDVDLNERTQRTAALLNANEPRNQLRIAFIEHWARESPALVYTIAHGSWGRRGMVGSGKMLVAPSAFLRYAHDGVWTELDAPEYPATPAVLFTTGCTLGKPDNELLAELFKHRWISACASSTETNGPMPLGPAINAEVNIARFLAAGMPIGVAVQATKHCYRDQTARDFTSWMPGTAAMRRINLLTYVLYGDPSLRVGPQAKEDAEGRKPPEVHPEGHAINRSAAPGIDPG